VLVTEMTGGFTVLLPMLAACFAAMLVPNLLHSPPIYESLRELAVRHQKPKTSLERQVHDQEIAVDHQ